MNTLTRNGLFFVIELAVGVVAMIALGELGGKLFNLKPKQKLKLILILYVVLVVILLKA